MSKKSDRTKASRKGKKGDEAKNDPEAKIRHAKKRAMLDALRSTLGLVSPAVRKLEGAFGDDGICRATHYHWMKTDPDYAAAVDAISDMELDFAESKLRELIKGVSVSRVDGRGNEHVYTEPPNVTAIMFYLNNKGAKRNYGNKIEVKHTKGGVIDPDMGDEG